MQTLTDIRAMLDERGLAPRKSLGQNFLIDQNFVRRLVEQSGVNAGDVVLEVGPGTGVLTETLLDRGCVVVAAELDRGLAELLRERLGGCERFVLVEGDCLASTSRVEPVLVDAVHRAMGDAGADVFALVANLPYGCATPLLHTLLVGHPACRTMAVTIQNEVIERLLATPDDGKAYGSLSVLAGSLATVTRLGVLPASCFWPRPGVTSGMVRLDRRDRQQLGGLTPERVGPLVSALFVNRRKQLGAVLRGHGLSADAAAAVLASDAQPTDRAERLSPEVLIRIAARLDGRLPGA